MAAANSLIGRQRRETPLFTAEGPKFYAQAFAHNEHFAKGGPYQTDLSPWQEQHFRTWVSRNQIPFNPDAPSVDYDMRGFWLNQQHHPQAQGRAGNGHFPDTFKTPFDTTFSAESRYASPDNPFDWHGNSLVDGRTGQLVYGRARGLGLQPKINQLEETYFHHH